MTKLERDTMDRLRAEASRLRAALRRVMDNEGGCNSHGVSCCDRYVTNPECWCGFCAARAALADAPKEGK
jgi:hypothetical protein